MDKWLREIEKQQNIEILFACEGGSRAWGASSSSSDQDVRLIFKHSNVRSYLSLTKPIETIDFSTPFDVHGWDIFKAFKLLQKSNPSLYEWVYSPIVYFDKDGFLQQLKRVIVESYSPFSLVMHYLSVISKNLKEVKRKDHFNEKAQKELIQAVRALLTVRNIIEMNSIAEGPYILSKSTLNKFEVYMNLLIEEKNSRSLISFSLVEEMVYSLESEKERLIAGSEQLSKGHDSTPVLNEWVWELLKV